MKILLLGEFSSLHRYLKEGLQQLGVGLVHLYANGDGWKQIGGADNVLFEFAKGRFSMVKSCVNAYKRAKIFCDYDVAQFVSPQLYPTLGNFKLYNYIKRRNNIVSIGAAGEDFALCDAFRNHRFDYYLLEYDSNLANFYSNDTIAGKIKIQSEKKIVNSADIIIPSLFEYYIGYENRKNIHSVIPFPINTDAIEYHENPKNEKIIFFHGINRELAKGTPFIREALIRLQTNYPNDVEVIIDGHMPFNKYLELMKRTNVVVDQCCSYGYGINACIAMAQGKVVMSGNRPETLKSFGINSSPIFHIQPDVEQIYQQMEFIVKNKNFISQWGYESRKYVENMHHYAKIAQRYVDAWKSTGKI